MNPLLWKREHRHALVIISLSGAIAGVLLGFIHSPYFEILETWQAFAAWLSNPASYWPWPLFGFIIAAVTFYAVQLLRSEN
jgi:Na+/proline symporter